MKKHYSAAIAVAFLLTASTLAAKAEDAAPESAAPAAAPTENKPASVARPSIVPKTSDTAAHRHYRRYAYWEPFPIYFPRFTRHHGIYWSRIPWFF
jgi:hypothetical protein